jgi:hypothetical protein
VHRISERCLRLVREAEQLVSGAAADVVVFSGWSSTGGRSEAEHTAENAARTLPLLLERGVRRAVVVCAPPHLVRTSLLFRRLYRGSGVEVGFRVARLAPTFRAVVWELGALPFLPLQVRAARAELARRAR